MVRGVSLASFKRQDTARNAAQRAAQAHLYLESPRSSHTRTAWNPPKADSDLRDVASRKWTQYCEFALRDTYEAYMDTYIATYRAGRPEGQN